MKDAEIALRKSIIHACLSMQQEGINQGTSGNISVRWPKGMLITPSGIPYQHLSAEDIIFVDQSGDASGPHAPSSEWRFHLDILKSRKDLNAVVHAHPTSATAIAITGEDIPAVHYMIAAAGGANIRCAPYATFGTADLSKHVIKALKGRTACLMANHGMVACGTTLDKAMWLAIEIEALSLQYIRARQFGTPQVLSDDEINVVVERFKSYGPKQKS